MTQKSFMIPKMKVYVSFLYILVVYANEIKLTQKKPLILENAGNQHDLDLNLGISNSSAKDNGSSRGVQYHPYDMQSGRTSKVIIASSCGSNSSLSHYIITGYQGLHHRVI